MRRDHLYLADILEACNDLTEFVTGVDYKSFITDKLRQGAVLQKLMVIGEAAARVSNDVKERYPEVEWAAVAGLRNRLVHGYFNVELNIVWTAAKEEAAILKEQIKSILDNDFA